MKYLLVIVAIFLFLPLKAQERKLEVESNHSTVGFSISIAGFTKVTGKFTDFQIYLDWSDSTQMALKIETQIKAASINTGIPDRDAHLRTADFFDVEKYPEITFISDSIKTINSTLFEAYGNLTMHGITKQIKLPFESIKIDGNTIGLRSRSSLNRHDYKIASDFKHSSMPNFLADSIDIEIDFWTKKRK